MSAFVLFRRPVCRGCGAVLRPLESRRTKVIVPGRRPENRTAQPSKSLDRFVPNAPVRARFAPSPTGYLHLGSLRTALFNYLIARRTGGQFILRLEDTDRKRLVPDAEKRLYDDLKWTGLTWDEGPDIGGPYGPYTQSERLDLYREQAARLLEEGKAYRCFCSLDEIESHRRAVHESTGTAPPYAGTCRHVPRAESDARAAAGERHAVRFRWPDELQRVPFRDVVFGAMALPVAAPDDFVVLKDDGFPTYHFANVVDDRAMAITHVVRGSEWLTSTPRHAALYRALGWDPPAFAHLSMLVNEQGWKLSKRQGDIDVASYRAKGYLPSALLNFVALLGWDPRTRKDVFRLEELEKLFNMHFTKGNVMVNLDKMAHYQKWHVRMVAQDASSPDDAALKTSLVDPIVDEIARLDGSDPPLPFAAILGRGPASVRHYVVEVLKRTNHPWTDAADFVAANRWLFWRLPSSVMRTRLGDLVPGARAVLWDGAARPPTEVLDLVCARLGDIPAAEWADAEVSAALADLHKRIGLEEPTKAPGWAFLRWAILGGSHGPSLADVLVLWGKQVSMEQFENARRAAVDFEEKRASRIEAGDSLGEQSEPSKTSHE